MGKIIGEYNFNPSALQKHSRKVEWIKSNPFSTSEILIPTEESRGAILFFQKNEIDQNFFFESKKNNSKEEVEKPKFVFIIDEINRGKIGRAHV